MILVILIVVMIRRIDDFVIMKFGHITLMGITYDKVTYNISML